jgi:hypothetical protein
MTDDGTVPMWPDDTVRWKMSAAWLARPHDCTLRGIMDRCGGVCCRSKVFWPPRTGENGCPLLGPAGCTLSVDDRPVTCLLYPLRVRGTSVAKHHVSTIPTMWCAGNDNRGPALVDAMRDQLVALFGADQYEHIRSEALAGRDVWVDVPPDVMAAYEAEMVEEEANVVPTPRTLRVIQP